MRIIYLWVGILSVIMTACGGGGGSSSSNTGASPSASMALNTSSLSFSATKNGSTPAYQDVNVMWSGDTVSQVEAEMPDGSDFPDWLTITKFGSGRSLTFEFQPSSTNLEPDTYDITVDIVARDANQTKLTSKSVAVTYTISDGSGTGGGDAGDSTNRATADTLYHFGQEIILNGANVAWSAGTGNWYNNDIGAADATGAPRTNITAFENHFSTIADAGGNSARIWLHTAATVTPVIQDNGTVSGLSRNLTNAQVVGQLNMILDAAWEEGVLVTFNLFSFNMLCDQNNPGPAKSMIEDNLQTYIDNALEPMVLGVKDHPAMFAWDIFNEPEGVTRTDYFCPSTEIFSYETLQVTVNQLAGAIHRLDPNVKVTMSTHTDLYDRFSNSTLLATSNADEDGTLDFYSLHWYDTGWMVSPHATMAGEFNADRPIVAGEFDVSGTGSGGPDAEDSISNLFDNGYAGAWPWSLTTGNVTLIENAITNGAAQSTTINRTAIEACIRDKPTDCYNP